MAGHSQHPTVFPFYAGEDLSDCQYHFVKMDDTAELITNSVVLCDTESEKAIGILVNKPTLSEVAQVARIGSRTKLNLDNDSLNPGDELTTDADGHGLALQGPDGIEYVNAILLSAPDDSYSGETLVDVLVVLYTIYTLPQG